MTFPRVAVFEGVFLMLPICATLVAVVLVRAFCGLDVKRTVSVLPMLGASERPRWRAVDARDLVVGCLDSFARLVGLWDADSSGCCCAIENQDVSCLGKKNKRILS